MVLSIGIPEEGHGQDGDAHRAVVIADLHPSAPCRFRTDPHVSRSSRNHPASSYAGKTQGAISRARDASGPLRSLGLADEPDLAHARAVETIHHAKTALFPAPAP